LFTVTVGNVQISELEHRLLYRIGQAYYNDGLTQEQIAGRFGLSRPKVSRLLQRARAEKIVDVLLVPPPSDMADTERALERRYGLEEAVVVPVDHPEDPGEVARALGPAAAECLTRCISGKGVIATTWGSSILAMVDALPYKPWPGVTVVQMLGGLGPVGHIEHSAELTQRIAQRFGAKLRLLPAPGIVATPEMAEALRSDSQIAQVLELAAQADIALVGLGVPSPESLLVRTGTILSQRDLELLQEAGAVGDISLCFLDAAGRPLDLELNARLVGLTLEQIARIPRVIGIAGGHLKHAIIRAALRGKILNVLITDQFAAQALLAEPEAGQGKKD
jgi:DNA-binding transcriptional regulator LsrR (DeoR family)